MGLPQAAGSDFGNTVSVRTTELGSRAPTLPASLEAQIPRTGDILDSKFRITGVLGSGGMGCVYLAEHLSLRRPVALKLLHPAVEGIDEVNLRFEREAFAIGRVDHPNCVNVSDFGRLEDGTLYMVLEVLDGISLVDLIEREGRIEWRRALHIARHVLSALASAHVAGIVHRDVKPENVILVQEDGDSDFAKILDFGIAKLFDGANLQSDDPQLTQLGVTIGTPTYIAPEQAFGQPIDARADLYALSVMLYEMIAGVPPFEAEEVVALLSMHTSAEVPPFRKAAPQARVPKSVEALIREGLEKHKEDRISTAEEYIARIDEIIASDGLPVDGESGLRELPSLVAEGFRDTVAPAVARVVTRRRSLTQIVTTTAMLIAVAALSVFIFGNKGPDYLPTRNHLPMLEPKHGPEAEVAAEMLEQGRPKEAAAYLIERKNDVREEPYAQMVLGHAHASAQRSILALVAYENAIELEPKLATDELMRTNVNLMLDKKAPGVVDDALEFLGTLVREVQDNDAEARLVSLASSDDILRRRQGAVAVVDELGLGGQVDRLQSYLLDLEQGASCSSRKDAVAKLRALGDKKAIPALRGAQKRIRTEGLLKKKVNTNACLRSDAAEAILYLQSM